LAAAGARLSEVQARALADRDQAAARAAEFELGLRAYGRSEHALAREVWTRLLAEDPTNTDVRTYLEKTEHALRAQVGAEAEEARRLEASRDWVAALAAWSRVHAADAHHPEAMPALARCRTALERGRRSESPRPDAPSAARAVATPRPTSQAFRDALAAYSDGDLQRAMVLLRSVRRDDPNHNEAQRLLAKAERALRPLGPEDRTRVRELYLRGMGHFTAHQFEAAIAEWTKILEIDPGNASVYQNIREARARLRAVQP
jgi:tetratricopeptide (TPR) repeat protein